MNNCLYYVLGLSIFMIIIGCILYFLCDNDLAYDIGFVVICLALFIFGTTIAFCVLSNLLACIFR